LKNENYPTDPETVPRRNRDFHTGSDFSVPYIGPVQGANLFGEEEGTIVIQHPGMPPGNGTPDIYRSEIDFRAIAGYRVISSNQGGIGFDGKLPFPPLQE